MLSADDLMLTITDKYEHRLLGTKGGKKDENVAFYSNAGSLNAEKGRKMLSATIVIKKGIINQIVGLMGEERQGKAHKWKGREKLKKYQLQRQQW